MKIAAAAVAASAILAAALTAQSGLDPASFDRSAAPGDDLYRYVNGAWLRDTPMPADRVTYGAFAEISDRTERDLRVLIDEVRAKPNRAHGSPSQQIADLYASVVDERRVEALGRTPIEPELKRIDAIASTPDVAAEAGRLSSIGAGGPFGGTVGRDPTNPGAPVARITPGGLLLPDRDYYLSTDAAHADVRSKYERYLARLFSLTGRLTPERDAADVLALETTLARVSRTDADTRRAPDADTRFTLRQLAAAMPGFDWQAWAHPQGLDRSPVVILAQPSFFKAFAGMVPRVPIDTWKAWLLARYVTAAAPYLSSPFEQARFDFFGTVLTGQELPRTRWKRGVAMVNTYLPDAIGKLYAERYFTSAARTRARRIVDGLVAAYGVALRDNDSLSARTKREALATLAAMQVRLGAPGEWHSYAGFEIKPDDLFGNWQRGVAFETRRQAGDADADPGRLWAVPPQTVNAFYSAASNEIVIPAAVLQPPVFDVDADAAVNYGSIGALVGHEIGHAFDALVTNGAQLTRLAAQLDRYRPVPGAHVNGALTSAETLADLGGLVIAYRAYRHSLNGAAAPVLDGLTGDQRFFMGWARMWRAKERDDYVRSQLQVSAHLPAALRANAALVNVDAYYDAFAVTPSQRLYLAPADRIRIW